MFGCCWPCQALTPCWHVGPHCMRGASWWPSSTLVRALTQHTLVCLLLLLISPQSVTMLVYDSSVLHPSIPVWCVCVCIGAQLGTVIASPLSGLLCTYGFDGGWPSVFYVFGKLALNLVNEYVVLWHISRAKNVFSWAFFN